MTTGMTSRLNKAWQGVAHQENARIRDAFVQNPEARAGSRAVLAYALAAGILVVYALSVLAGLWFAGSTFGLWSVWGLPKLTTGFMAFMLLLMCWQARPRVPSYSGKSVTETEAPEFYALVRRVAEQLSAPVPTEIYLLPYVNAFMGQGGWQRTPVLGYGLPLWFALHPQERVAVLAHELAHQRNGDPARSGLIGAALNMLVRLYHMIMPDALQRMNGGIYNRMSNIIMTMLAQIPYLLFQVLTHLMGAEHQAAEYRADLLGARIAGTKATLETLKKLHYTDMLESALHKQRHFPEQPHAFLELGVMWDSLSEEAREQRKAEINRRNVRLDDSHPPTRDRMQVVMAHPAPPAIELSAEQAAKIDQEFTPFVRLLEQQAYDTYRERYGI